MKTLVIGASEKPERYAHQAVRELVAHNQDVAAIGVREGRIGEIPIRKGQPPIEDLDTVTLYVGPQRQEDLIDYVVGLKPRRVIFNPGTENPAFAERLREAGIEPLEACTLVMLRTGQWA
jgi:predicted CoA-binding protein